MYLNFQANLVIAGAIFLCVLWIVAERKNWRLFWRVVIGVSAIIFVSQVMVAFCQLRAATREHYFRTVLFNLSHEAAAGQTNLVCKLLLDYGKDHKNARYLDDMTAVNNLYSTMTQIDNMRRENNKNRSDSARENMEEVPFIQRAKGRSESTD